MAGGRRPPERASALRVRTARLPHRGAVVVGGLRDDGAMEGEAEIDLAGIAVGDSSIDRSLGRQVGDMRRVGEQNFDYFPGDVEVRPTGWVDQVVVTRDGGRVASVHCRLARIEWGVPGRDR